MTVVEAKADKLSESKNLLLKISTKLDKDAYTQFKIALNNFYVAKKGNNAEGKVKYYKILRALFANDLEFFADIEKFIQFTGVIKEKPSDKAATSGTLPAPPQPPPPSNSSSSSSSNRSLIVKRKFDERD